MDSKVEIKFVEDTIKLYGCDMFLGQGTYSLDKDDNFSVRGFSYIEICSMGSIKMVEGIIYSQSIDLIEDVLLIYSTDYEQRDFILRFIRKGILEY